MPSEFTPEQIAEAQAAYDAAVRVGATNVKELGDRLRDMKVGIEGYTAELESSKKLLRSSAMRLGQGIISGNKGMSQYNEVVGAAADGLSLLAKGIPIIGTAVGGLVKSVGWYAKKVTEQADALNTAYQDVAKVGVTGARGMQGVFDSAQKFGYTVNELGNFGSLMRENAETLARMGGTATEGAEKFADMSSQLIRSEFGRHLQNMGMTIDDLNKGQAQYLRLKTQSGQAQHMTTQELVAGAAEYLEQSDKLAKLTGKDAASQAKLRQDALEEEKFGASQRILNRGTEEDKKKAKLYEDLNVLMSDMPSLAKGMRDVVAGGGALTSEEAIQLSNVAPQTLQMMREGRHTKEEIYANLQKELRGSQKFRDQLASQGVGSKAFGSAYEASIASNRKDIQDSGESADRQQNVTNDATKNMVKFDNAQRDTTQALDKGFNLGLKKTTSILSTAATGAKIVTGIPGSVAPSTLAPAGGGSIGGGKPKAPPAGPGVNDKSGPPGKAENLLQFGSGTGSKTNFDGLSGPMKNAVLRAAEQYNQQTGKLIKINSANRTYEEQQRLYNQLAPQGKPVAKPGNSNHEQGNAVDIQNYKDSAAVSAMRGQGLFNNVPNDPQHFSGSGFATGGIAQGPKSGYSTTLHGTEAVVPLPNGKSIPVEMNNEYGVDEQNDMMAAQVEKMAELYKIMQSQLNLTNKILQRTI